MNLTYIDKHKAAEMLSVTQWTVRQWRKTGKLTEGIHYVWLTPRSVRYIKEALENLLLNGGDPDAHKAWCREFLAQKEQLKKVVSL